MRCKIGERKERKGLKEGREGRVKGKIRGRNEKETNLRFSLECSLAV